MFHYDVLLAYIIMGIVLVILLCLAGDAWTAHTMRNDTPTPDDFNHEDDLP